MCACQEIATARLWKELQRSPYADVFLTGDAWEPFSRAAVGRLASGHEVCARCAATRSVIVWARRLTGTDNQRCACCGETMIGPDVLLFGASDPDIPPFNRRLPVVG